MDGKKQRNALTAAEQAIRALAIGDGDRARLNSAKAADLDQIGLFAALPGAVADGAAQIDAEGAVAPSAWDAVAAAVGPGPLQHLVSEVRG